MKWLIDRVVTRPVAAARILAALIVLALAATVGVELDVAGLLAELLGQPPGLLFR